MSCAFRGPACGGLAWAGPQAPALAVRPARPETSPRLAARLQAQSNGSGPEPTIRVPPLYAAWFEESGELRAAVLSAIAVAAQDGTRTMEVQFPCVPNVDEVAFGTALNQQFAIEISAALGMTAKGKYAQCRRYLVSFANLYWALAIASSFSDRTVWLVSTDSVSKRDAVEFVPNAKLASITRIKPSEIAPTDVVIVMDPGPTDLWRRAAKLRVHPDNIVIMMNPSFVETYDLCGPLEDYDQVFFLKRVSKGWVHRVHGHGWHLFLEKPDQALELLVLQPERPKLGEASRILRGESFKRFGIFNDRWSQGFGARL